MQIDEIIVGSYVLLCIVTFFVRMWDIETDSKSEILRHMDKGDIIASTIFMSVIPILNVMMLVEILYRKLIKRS